MKLKSLILGSVAAAGLSTAGYAADLGVLTSLDVCDALGLSGLTISSDTNCLQISGGVTYNFQWGDYENGGVDIVDADEAEEDPDLTIGTVSISDLDATYINTPYDTASANIGDGINDWQSRVDYWLKFVGTADSDFGPASATIKIKETQDHRTYGYQSDELDELVGSEVVDVGERHVSVIGGSDTDGVVIDEAYVSIGDSTVIMAGKKSSIANFGDDEPLNFLGLFGSDAVDSGVGRNALSGDFLDDGGHVIQVVSDLGNGVSVGVALENLDRITDADLSEVDGLDPDALDDASASDLSASQAGALIGVVSYAGEGISAHVTGIAGGILDGDVEAWAVHAGFTGTFDMFQVRVAGAYEDFDGYEAIDSDDDISSGTSWNVLASAAATFDLFTLAISGEALDVDEDGGRDGTDYGFGGSVGANVTEGVSINLGGRYYSAEIEEDRETYQVALQVVAAVTESISITGEAGYVSSDVDFENTDEDSLYYGAAELGWAPGGDFTSSLRAEANSLDAYKVTFNAAKTFQ